MLASELMTYPLPLELHPRSWTKKEIKYECSSKESHRVI
jgi:hypothetical protein